MHVKEERLDFPSPAAEVVQRVVSKRSVHRPARNTLDVFEAFRRLGPPLTRQAEPLSFRAGCLTLRVFGSAWLTELSFMIPDLKRRLNHNLKGVQVEQVRLVAGRPTPSPPPVPASPRLTPAELAQVEAWAAPIQRPEVRLAVLRAAAQHLANRSDRNHSDR